MLRRGADVPPAQLMRCGICLRRTKKWPRSPCVDCPGKVADLATACEPLAPRTNQPPAPPPAAELQSRVRAVHREGNQYNLRDIMSSRGESAQALPSAPLVALAAVHMGAKRAKSCPSSETEAAAAIDEEDRFPANGRAARTADSSDEDDDDDPRDADEATAAVGAAADKARPRGHLPGNAYPASELLDCVEVLGARAYLVLWEGYPLHAASWEIEEHITPDLVSEYRERRGGSATTRLEPTRAELPSAWPSLEPNHELALVLEAIKCGTFKYKQKGTPGGGYLRRTKGVLMAVRSCNLVMSYTECFGSER